MQNPDLGNLEILQSKQNLFKVCSEISVKTCIIIENQLTGFYNEPTAVSEKTIRNFEIIEKSEMHYLCK